MVADISPIQHCYQQCQLLISEENYEQAIESIKQLHQLLIHFSKQAENINAHAQLLVEINDFVEENVELLTDKASQLKLQLQEINTATKMQKAYGQ
jgi:hypothetical protein